MLKEDGIQATVDHLHRTIYGAILAGNTFSWMKGGAERAIDSVIEEVETEKKEDLPSGEASRREEVSFMEGATGGGRVLRGFLAIPTALGGLFGGRKTSVASRLNEAGGGAESVRGEAEGEVAGPSLPRVASTRQLRPVEIAEENIRQSRSNKSGGMFSFLGC